MGCKNCAELQESKESFGRQLYEERKLTKFYRESLEAAQAKPTVEDLFKAAGTAAQIASLNEKAFPAGSPITDEASAVALGALKQIRERLGEEEGMPDLADALEKAKGSGVPEEPDVQADR